MDSMRQTTQYQDFNAAWEFWKRWGGIDQSDEQWAECVADAERIREEHGDRKFCRDLVLAVTCELERKSKAAMG
ncbi:MAG: hypothetical protein IJ716_09380 [Lachnospiraceae bacterium]|nr:hypothetical protein [Lachnospiraceae bacterium]